MVMIDNLEQIKANTLKARDLMRRSREQHFSVGAFNVDSLSSLTAIARVAKRLNSPVIIEVSKSEIDYIGRKNIRDLVDNCKTEYGVEMYINLDHGPSVEEAKLAIEAGFEFIHIDISQADHNAPMEEIINKTKEVVEYARLTGALVEGEPHYFGGSSNVFNENIDYDEVRKTFTKPEEAKDFIEQTGIDTFAAAIGNLHGKYNGPKQLDIDLLSRIRQTIDPSVNISLHGGSGTPLRYFIEAASVGVSKVNINTDLRYAYRTMLDKVLADNPHEYAVFKLMPAVNKAIESVVEDKIKSFGSEGKAVL